MNPIILPPAMIKSKSRLDFWAFDFKPAKLN